MRTRGEIPIELSSDDSIYDLAEGMSVPRRFSEAREERLAPSAEELRAMSLDDADEEEPLEAPIAMTSNDAFRIIELIKEREALRAARGDRRR